jgi:hypothetical protein
MWLKLRIPCPFSALLDEGRTVRRTHQNRDWREAWPKEDLSTDRKVHAVDRWLTIALTVIFVVTIAALAAAVHAFLLPLPVLSSSAIPYEYAGR